MTGAFVRPTLNHGPLPRLKPQPLHITGMITKRLRVRQWRSKRLEKLRSLQQDAKLEEEFERTLLLEFHADAFKPAFINHEWGAYFLSVTKLLEYLEHL